LERAAKQGELNRHANNNPVDKTSQSRRKQTRESAMDHEGIHDLIWCNLKHTDGSKTVKSLLCEKQGKEGWAQERWLLMVAKLKSVRHTSLDRDKMLTDK
jgi:hypothetical protein